MILEEKTKKKMKSKIAISNWRLEKRLETQLSSWLETPAYVDKISNVHAQDLSNSNWDMA